MLGIVSDADFEREVKDIALPVILPPAEQLAQIIDIKRGRGHVREIPNVIREIIAEDAIATNKTQKEVASEFGVSPSSVSAYLHGATSTASYDKPDKELQDSNNKVRTDIISSARSRLISALSHITPDKLAEAKLRDVASVAKDMAAIIKNIEPDIKETEDKRAPQFIFFAPNVVREEVFETVYSKE